MSDQTSLPFNEVLELIFTADPLPIHLLYRLSDIPTSEFPRFREKWALAPEERRRIIVRHLADLSEDNFLVDFIPVFSLCFADESDQVRIAALDGIWDSTDESLVAPVITLLQTDDVPEVRAAAAAALAHFIVLAEWGQLPEHISPPIVEALLAEYDKPETVTVVKRSLLEALGSATHPRVSSLIEDAYESDYEDMQISALFAMGATADSRWLPIIFEEMESPYADMREEAARAAGALNDESAVPELAALAADEEPSVAAAAVQALGQLGGEHAGNVLLQLTEDPGFEDLRETIDEALEHLEWLDGSFNYLDLDLADDIEFEED